MEAKELRIGNWVKVEKHETPVDCHEITQLEIAPGSINIIPIPLTEEWLVKFGFKTNNPKVGWYKKDGFDFTTRLSGSALSVSVIFDGRHIGISKVQYLHQLQNLYFALTSEELTSL